MVDAGRGLGVHIVCQCAPTYHTTAVVVLASIAEGALPRAHDVNASIPTIEFPRAGQRVLGKLRRRCAVVTRVVRMPARLGAGLCGLNAPGRCTYTRAKQLAN